MFLKMVTNCYSLNIVFTAFFFLSSLYLFGQAKTKQVTFGYGSAATSRILMLDEASFNEGERAAAKELEIPRLSHDLSVGFNYALHEKHELRFGVSHRWLKFGTRKYNVPDSINTPSS